MVDSWGDDVSRDPTEDICGRRREMKLAHEACWFERADYELDMTADVRRQCGVVKRDKVAEDTGK